jgi:hypothetical protein
MAPIRTNQLTIQSVTNEREFDLACGVRTQVFERELGIRPESVAFPSSEDALHLIARIGEDGPAVAALSAVSTTGQDQLHERYGLLLPPLAKVVRYTQLAVLKKYRGLNLPLQMILEANAKFTKPLGFTHGWLALPVRAGIPAFVQLLGFERVGTAPVPGAQGPSWTLLRRERVIATIEEMRHSAIPRPEVAAMQTVMSGL